MIVVMDEVIVIMAMPVIAAPIGAMPNSTAAIPARTAVPAAGGKARATHRTTKTTTAPTCEVGTAIEVTSHATAKVASATETVGSVRCSMETGTRSSRPQGQPRQEPCAFS
jgi:hypothetical protein